MDQLKDRGENGPALAGYRDEIDRIDREIVDLLKERQNVAARIGQVKRELGLGVLDRAREEEVLRRATSLCGEDLPEEAVRSIFTEIVSAARAVQQPPSVSFLGPEGTFCNQAALNIFGHSTTLRSADTISEVFDLVEKGICGHGVVPVENSYEGSVNQTLDLLYRHDLKITGEAFLRIRHHLLGRADSVEEIKVLYSHPMALGQCRSWIRENLPKVSLRGAESTSAAARRAAREAGAGAIGSRTAGLSLGLDILVENIEDSPNNITRFLVIGKDRTSATGRDKTSLVFTLRHEPGALHRALEPLASRRINMNRIESRPMKRGSWEYLFFVDVEGHENDDTVNQAVGEMEKACSFIKTLGSYPSGGEPWDQQ
ncbi:MAG: prephenate dehydratase [Deltaproteobacteria bacterium]|nr:prephenate dehydratase [Deltaproteobacteria bacterium]